MYFSTGENEYPAILKMQEVPYNFMMITLTPRIPIM